MYSSFVTEIRIVRASPETPASSSMMEETYRAMEPTDRPPRSAAAIRSR